MKTKNGLYGALCGALVFAILSWVAPRKAVNAAVLATPPEGRFELVQLHPSSGVEWSGILDTETGCTWTYTTHTPPTDAEVKAAPEGPLRDLKSYYQILGNEPVFEMVEYDAGTEPAMSRPGEPKPSTLIQAMVTTSMTEKSYCNQARQSALRAAASR